MKKKLTLIFALSLMLNTYVKSAVFIETSVTGTSGKHKLYLSIPDNYDATKKYPLVIGLHYCGGNGISYRLGLKPLSDSLKMIVACPDNSGNLFDNSKIDLITASIDSVKAKYNIDTASVYLNGMSCNGEVTMQQGMKKLYPFKGIFPWAPYISKVDNKAIDLNSDMPVTLAIGTLDEYYYGVILNLYDSLKTHGANVNLVLVPGINHTQFFPQFGNEMIHAINYINDNNKITIKPFKDNADSYQIYDTDAEKLVEYKVSHLENKELLLNSISSNLKIIGAPEINYTPADSTVKIKFKPIPGKVGTVIIVLEAKEKNGLGVEQVTFKVKVAKNPTSLTTFNTESKMTVYPNPAGNLISFQCDDQIQFVEIADIQGRLILKTAKTDRSSIDISSLKRGMYFLIAEGQNRPYRVKFSKQ
jgi:hypothetical protein